MFALAKSPVPAARLLPRMATLTQPRRVLAAPSAAVPQLRAFRTSSLLRVEDTRSGAPGSKDLGHAAQNVKEDVASTIKTAQTTVTGGRLPPGHEDSLEELVRKSPVRGASSDEPITETLKHGTELTEAMIAAVPTAAKFWGAAGSVPILGSTVASVWFTRDAWLASLANNPEALNHAVALAEQAQYAQITVSAVLLSFVGAMHWGLEFAGYGGNHGNERFVLGVAPFVAGWASLALSPSLALGLVAQWFSWVGAWYLDLKATKWGWTPPWYSTYRFWLTSVVGISLFGTLIGTRHYEPTEDLSGRHTPDQRLANAIQINPEADLIESRRALQGGGSLSKILPLSEDVPYTAVPGEQVNSTHYVVMKERENEEEEEEGAGGGEGEGEEQEGAGDGDAGADAGEKEGDGSSQESGEKKPDEESEGDD